MKRQQAFITVALMTIVVPGGCSGVYTTACPTTVVSRQCPAGTICCV